MDEVNKPQPSSEPQENAANEISEKVDQAISESEINTTTDIDNNDDNGFSDQEETLITNESLSDSLSDANEDASVKESAMMNADGIDSSPKKKPKTAVIIAVIVIVVIAAAAIGFFVHSENEKRAAEEARIAEIEEYNAYVDKLSDARYTMLTGLVTAETAGNLLVDVWHDAIFERNIDSWSDETRPYYATDFNEALKLLFASDTYQGYISTIEDNEKSVEAIMKDLRNPPEGCERAYDEVQEFYTTYKSFTKLVTSPSGSYQTTSQSLNNLDSEAITHYEKLETLIPDKKEVK